MRTASVDVRELAAALGRGNRRALAEAVTLIESTREDHREAAEELLTLLLPMTGNSVRLGVSGAPGVGKSTFIEALGLTVIDADHRLAVLAVDPSSKRGGGSILGDKMRMAELARHEEAFIRPSPAGTSLGGVARRTRDVTLVVEAAGFDVVIIETVGAGQADTAVADMVDLFLLLLAPDGGELQGIKKGIVELADLLVINKADGEFEVAALRAMADYQNAVRLLRPTEAVDVLAVSALGRKGIDQLWQEVERRIAGRLASDGISRRRAAQARAALWSEIRERLIELFTSDAKLAKKLAQLEGKVVAGQLTPTAAVNVALKALLGRRVPC